MEFLLETSFVRARSIVYPDVRLIRFNEPLSPTGVNDSQKQPSAFPQSARRHECEHTRVPEFFCANLSRRRMRFINAVAKFVHHWHPPMFGGGTPMMSEPQAVFRQREYFNWTKVVGRDFPKTPCSSSCDLRLLFS